MDKKKRKTRHKNRYKLVVEQKHTLHNKDTQNGERKKLAKISDRI